MDECANNCGQVMVPDKNFHYIKILEGGDIRSFFWDEIVKTNILPDYVAGNTERENNYLRLNVLASSTPFEARYRNNALTLCVGVEYTVRVNCVAVLGTAPTFYVRNNGIEYAIGVASAGELILLFTAQSPEFEFGYKDSTSVTGGQFIALNNFRLIVENGQDYVCDAISQNINYKTDHGCSLVLNGTNDNDAFGFRFKNKLFSPTIRLGGRLAPSDKPYMTESKSVRLPDGNKRVYYHRSQKMYALAIHNATPETIDFLRMLMGMDYIYVNDKLITFEDDDFPRITWNRERTLGKMVFEVTMRPDLVEKVRTTNEITQGYPLENSYLATENGVAIVTHENKIIKADLI
jgi:hypothetical protein